MEQGNFAHVAAQVDAVALRGPSCPLTTSQLCDVLMSFAEMYGELHGIQLHSYQRVFMRRIFESVLDREGNVVTGLWSRQSGKSEALSSLAPALCILLPALANSFAGDKRLTGFQQGFWMGIFAPKQQQATIIYQRIRSRAEKDITREEIYSDADLAIGVASSRGDEVSWTNGSYVTAQTASEHSNVEGKTYHLVIIDEAQLVSKAKVNKEIKPMLAHTNGVLVEIGTANALRGNFRETIVWNIENLKKTGKRDHYEFPYDKVIEARRETYRRTGDEKHLSYEKWIAGELRRLGNNKENEEFRQNFRLLWVEANSGAVDLESFYAAGDVHRGIESFSYSGRIVAGLDFGKKRDVTVLTVMEVCEEPLYDASAIVRPGDDKPVFFMKRIIAWHEIEGKRWNQIIHSAVEILQNYAVSCVVCDGTGVGDPLTEAMQDLMPSTVVVPFVMSHIGNDKAYKLYLQELEAGRISYPADKETLDTQEYQSFKHEHEQLIRDRVGVFMKCYAPEGEHDDYCDSAALACWGASLKAELTEVVAEENPFYSRKPYGQAGQSRSRSDRYRS
jgi:hypothetical protein